MNTLSSLVWIKRAQLLLSALAVVMCLISVSSVHHHQDGYHALGSDCLSCALNDLTAHGVAPSQHHSILPQLIEDIASKSIRDMAIRHQYHNIRVRAPPLFS